MARASIKALDLSSFSAAQLRLITEQAQELEATKREEAKVELKEKVTSMIEDSGFKVSDLFGGRGTGSKSKSGYVRVADRPGYTPKSARVYRNPENSDQEWHGRGRKPGWLMAYLDKGKKLEQFEVRA